MGVVDQAVEDGVGVSGVADQRVPLIHRELAGDDGGAATVAVLEDLREVVAGRGIERVEAPVVEDEQIDAAKRPQQTGVAAVVACQSKTGEQPGCALIERRALSRQGLLPSAEASQLLPTSEGPQIKRLTWSSIHPPSTSIVKRLRSTPRGVR